MSNINPQNIDGTFPIAGQDNNSQGFRDNFTNTINNFTFAAAELTDLQTYAVLTAPLSSAGQTGTPTNNMNYTPLTKAQLIGAVETVVSPTVATGAFTIDWSLGHFQQVTIVQNTTMSFASTWPTTNLWTKLRLQVTVTGGTWTLTFPTSVTVNVSNIQGWTSGTTISLPASTTPYIFEFSTSDNGSTVTIQDVLRNYNTETAGNSATFSSLTITGNVIRAGGQIDSGYQYSNVLANVGLTVGTSVARLILDPTQTVSTYVTAFLPGGNVDAKIVTISSTQTVQFLNVVASNGTT